MQCLFIPCERSDRHCASQYLCHGGRFNNLSDAGSSIIGLVGVKMAEKPADEEHPFGHGRIEYIAALIVAFIVLEVGFTFLKDAIGKIRQPEILKFNTVSVVILMFPSELRSGLLPLTGSWAKRSIPK